MSASVKKCEVCDDTGSKSRDMRGDLDCTACTAADDRSGLRWLLALRPSEDDSDVWRAYLHGLSVAAAPVAPVAAQPVVPQEPVALATSGGNAAPPDACPIAITDSSAPNGIKWYVEPPDHLKNGMNLYFVPSKIIPASAPNAALVAALGDLIDVAERCDSWESFPSNSLDKARAALSAAGQEVGHG